MASFARLASPIDDRSIRAIQKVPIPMVESRKSTHPLASGALVVGLGLLALYASSLQSFRFLSWSDEIVYAVMGRNVADGRGVVSNFYDVLSILRKGFPLGDVHMPGQAFLLAVSFRVLGPTEFAAFLPSAAAFVLSGLLLFDVGRRLFGEEVGVGAAALFYVTPPMTGYAHTAMPELLLVLLGCFYLAIWCRALTGTHVVLAGLLALVLGLGLTVRETFLVFVPPAVYVLARWPRPERSKGLLVFGVVFLGYLLLILRPLYAQRAPYPNFLSALLDQGGAGALWRAAAANAIRNLTGLPFPGGHPSGWAFACQYLSAVFLALFCLRRWPGVSRPIAVLALASYLAAVLALAGVYPLLDLTGGLAEAGAATVASRPPSWWGGVRALMFLAPISTLLLAFALFRIESPALRRGALGLAIGLLIFVSIRNNAALVADRIEAYRFDQPFSRLVAESTARFQPRTVVAEWAFLYGWAAYPVTVIWRATAQPDEIAALEPILPIDAILVGELRRSALEDGVRTGALKGGYRIVDRPRPGVYLFVSAERLKSIGATEPRP